MSRYVKGIAAVFAVAMAVSAADADAQVRFSIAGGPSFPTGDEQHLDMGFHVQAGADFGMPLLPFGLRLDGAFNRFKDSLDDGNYDVVHGAANAVLNIPLVVATPYLIGGLGVYAAEDKAHGEERVTNLGFNVGAGIRLPLPGLSVFAEARLHNPFDQEVRFVPISLGFRF
jgi:hypothetical protein